MKKLLLSLDLFALIGYILLLTVKSSGVKYFACYMIAIPLYCGPGLNEICKFICTTPSDIVANVSELGISNNMAPQYRRATAIGIQQSVGNLAGIVAPQVYRSAPYRLGHWCSLGATILSMALIGTEIIYLAWRNRQKDGIKQGTRDDDRTETTGEGHLDFEYIL